MEGGRMCENEERVSELRRETAHAGRGFKEMKRQRNRKSLR